MIIFYIIIVFALFLFSFSAWKSIQHNEMVIKREDERLEKDKKRLNEIKLKHNLK